MRFFSGTLFAVALNFLFCLAAFAQTPGVYLKFDGTLSDSSAAGIVTAVNANGFTPSYTADRNGAAGKALLLPGSGSVQLVAGALLGNSNEALGLRNSSGTNTSAYTLAAWVYFDAVGAGQGYNTIFGNLGSGGGTLHAGLGLNSDKAHFGFEGNDANGVVGSIVAGAWFHLAFVYNPSENSQRIYINGIPELKRSGVVSSLKSADLLLGNWGAPTDSSNDLKGAIDDVVVFNSALNIGQIQALFNGVDANNLPVSYSEPKLPGVQNTDGNWGVREIKGYPGITYGTLLNADRIIRAYAATPAGTVASYQVPVLNLADDEAPGHLGNFISEGDFGTNTPADDNNFLLIAKSTVRIAVEDDYTFGFLGDDGARLRILGKTFVSSAAINASTGNPSVPAHQGDGIYYTTNVAAAGNSGTIGVVHLTPGDYNLELTYWEAAGTSSIEVFAARGAKTAFDSTFQLVGNTASGGLPLVRDPDTLPQINSFTANGGGFLSVNGGVPSNFVLAWQTNAIPTTVTINQGIGTVAQNGSITIAAPAQTTTYTITASSGTDVVTKNVTVYVDAPPVIASFTANPSTIRAGAAVTLNWMVDGADTLVLDPGNFTVTGQSTLVLNPLSGTTYTLTATNVNGTVQKSASVVIGVAPVINSFVAGDPNPLFGAETGLTWDVAGADSLSINQGIGTVVGATGSVSIAPIQTTTYTFTATNVYGTTTRTVTVNQATPIGVASPGFTVRRVTATASTPIPFAGQGYLQSADSLLSGQNAQTSTSITVTGVTTINYSSGADGDFTSGNVAFPGNGGDNFAVKVTGTLIVNTPGEYTFVVNSDDGARLRIDGQDVIVDESTHSPAANSSRVTLTKSSVQLELVYYNVTGGAEVELGWIRPNSSFQLLGVISPAAPVVRGQLLISEFMADSSGASILDEDGVSSDWIEVWNSTNSTINLSGYFLTDDPAVPNKWALPAWTLGPNKYLIVFASTNDRRPAQAAAGQDNAGTPAQPHLHANFKLSKAASYLALTQANGTNGFDAISAFAPVYPAQRKDISYGSSDAEGYVGFMEVPTPGFANAATVMDFVTDTHFTQDRGRYSTSFPLAITTSTPGAQIRYTIDGSTPTLNHGTIYSGPIPISKTTVVRAAAFKPGWKATNVDTQTYLFVDDIVSQTAATATALGFPAVGAGANGQVFRYGMTLANVTAGGGSLASLKSALAAAPTVCLTTDIANLVNATTGIYVNPGGHGLFWERPASVEYINTAGTSEFQIDCGVRIRGGASRTTGNAKHAFHLYFRSSLYEGKLNYRLFGTAGASEFSQIDLRCEENNSWSKDNSSQNALLREEWSRQTQGDMGQPYARNGYFHLYINGIYWGVYNFEERTEAAFGETYLGGSKDNIDVVKSAGSSGSYNTEMTDGNFAAWQALFNLCVSLKNDLTEAGRTAKFLQIQGLNPNGTRNPAFPVLLDVNNLIDYLLVVYYDGSFDSPMSTFLNNASNNWFGIRDRLSARGYVFFAHDQEHGMNSSGTESYNRVGPWGAAGNNNWGQAEYGTRETFAKSNPHYYHELLAYSAEYRQRFADRVQRHFFNGGALTTAKSLARVNTLAAQVDPIIHAEAARWGSTSLNRNTWLSAKAGVDSFINNGGNPASGQTVFPVQPRTTLVLAQLKGYQDPIGSAKALFPSINAPVFSGQFGGSVSNPFTFTISNSNAFGTLYYTVNGADPRPIGGGAQSGGLTGAGPISVTLNNTSTVRARVYDSATQQWSPLTETDYLVGTLAAASNLVVSKLNYNPPTAGGLEEFIELMNISNKTLDLTKVAFTLGVQFEFPSGFLLAPGARTLIVRDMAAFAAAYPGVPAAQIAGVFVNSSLNNGGERLLLVDSAGAAIRDFTYNNKSPWPESPDGGGPALVLIRPETNPDPGNGANWRPSSVAGGLPGVVDSLTYPEWAFANGIADLTGAGDSDGDGLTNLAEYAMGLNPATASTLGLPVIKPQIVGALGEYLTLAYKHSLNRDDAAFVVEASSDLVTWTPAIITGSPTFNADGTETVTYRHPNLKASQQKQFLRLRTTRQQ